MTTLEIQFALSRLGYEPGRLDGQTGPRTRAALDAAGLRGRDPAAALAVLLDRVDDMQGEVRTLTIEEMQAFEPKFPRRWLYALNASLVYGLITRERLPYYLAQLAHESAGFATLEEYASGDAYEGRADLGNTEPGDGRRYKGRGPIQLTGRANYRRYGGLLELDLEERPEQAAEPRVAFQIAALYWLDRGINALADVADFTGVTRAINGGTNGLPDRLARLAKAQALFGGGGALADAAPPQTPDVTSAPPESVSAAPSTPASPAPPQVAPAPLSPAPPRPAPSPRQPRKERPVMSTTRARQKEIRRIAREKRDFWLGQYLQYRAEGLSEADALEEVAEDFRDYALTMLAQRLDKAARWRWINNPQVRALFEEHDGGAFLALLKGMIRVADLARAPVAGLLADRVGAGVAGSFMEAFADMLDGQGVDEPVVVDEPSDDPTVVTSARPRLDRPGAVIDHATTRHEVLGSVEGDDVPTWSGGATPRSADAARSRLLGLTRATDLPGGE